MTILSYAQMEGYWIKAGGAPALAPIAAAIGEAESGGNTDIVNRTDNNGRQSSYGVWQISNGTHSPPSPNWADPATNASLAVAKYKAGTPESGPNSFSPWGTYDSGAYTAYISGKTSPDLNVQGNPGAIPAETAADVQADCLLGIGGIPGTSWWSDIFGNGGNVGNMCFVTRSNARGYIGALLLAAGTIGAGLMLGLLGAVAGQQNGLADKAGQFGLTFAAPELAAAGAAAGAASSKTASSSSSKGPGPNVPRGKHAGTGSNALPKGRHATTGPNAPAGP